MSGESKSRGTELTDEEMDRVSGGMALIIQDKGTTRVLHKCTRRNISGEEFRANIYDGNTCDRYSAKNSHTPKRCSNCSSYVTSATEYGHWGQKPSLESYSANETLQGYDIVFIEA